MRLAIFRAWLADPTSTLDALRLALEPRYGLHVDGHYVRYLPPPPRASAPVAAERVTVRADKPCPSCGSLRR